MISGTFGFLDRESSITNLVELHRVSHKWAAKAYDMALVYCAGHEGGMGRFLQTLIMLSNSGMGVNKAVWTLKHAYSSERTRRRVFGK